jgi:hypothetical protein
MSAISAALGSSQYRSRCTADSRVAVPRQTAPTGAGETRPAAASRPAPPRAARAVRRLGVGAEELDVYSRTASSTCFVAGHLSRARAEPARSRAALRLALAYSMPSSTTSRAAAAAISSADRAHGRMVVGAGSSGRVTAPMRATMVARAAGHVGGAGSSRSVWAPAASPPAGPPARAPAGGVDAEVVPRRGLGAEHAFAPLHVVQVDLQDALLGQQASSISVSTSSCPLRSTVRSPDRNRFLASCWVMVEPPTSLASTCGAGGWQPPCARRGARRLRHALRRAGCGPGLFDGVPLDAAVLGEAGVLAGDHGALEVRRCAA